ncbi:hypothetical protein BJ508DRAFT_242885 [Ascobolus immersus RN42]|uniref:2-dehydropantoate 2-reductase n=1 Tax=Ascobolus immersus RN42 TaxID=1160509 RepID=A0A3N4HQ10_ASCIM|nr:hypothetical protein BJ508DRAFT_242885 [Ascobolus immersus RN42]
MVASSAVQNGSKTNGTSGVLPDKKTRVLIYGVGAVGAIYASLFLAHPEKYHVTLLARSNHTALSTNGITITSVGRFGWNNSVFRPNGGVYDSFDSLKNSADYQPYDILLITTKWQPYLAASVPKDVVKDDGLCVLIQNGVGIEESFFQHFNGFPSTEVTADHQPRVHLISGVIYIIASQPSPGVFLHGADREFIYFGLYPEPPMDPKHWGDEVPPSDTYIPSLPLTESTPEPLRRAIETFLSIGSDARLPPSLQTERWRKCVWNGTFNVMCALTGLDSKGVLAQGPSMESTLRRLGKEIEVVAKAIGVHTYDAVEEAVINDARRLPGFEPSMLQDVRAGREMEVEGFCGNVVRLGKGKGVEVGVMESMYVLLTAMNQKFIEKRKQSGLQSPVLN